jgi:hypothetical protein
VQEATCPPSRVRHLCSSRVCVVVRAWSMPRAGLVGVPDQVVVRAGEYRTQQDDAYVTPYESFNLDPDSKYVRHSLHARSHYSVVVTLWLVHAHRSTAYSQAMDTSADTMGTAGRSS